MNVETQVMGRSVHEVLLARRVILALAVDVLLVDEAEIDQSAIHELADFLFVVFEEDARLEHVLRFVEDVFDLTPREAEVCGQLMLGASAGEIAENAGRSPKTVRKTTGCSR